MKTAEMPSSHTFVLAVAFKQPAITFTPYLLFASTALVWLFRLDKLVLLGASTFAISPHGIFLTAPVMDGPFPSINSA